MEQEEKFVLPYDVPANEYLNIEGRKPPPAGTMRSG